MYVNPHMVQGNVQEDEKRSFSPAPSAANAPHPSVSGLAPEACILALIAHMCLPGFTFKSGRNP